MQLLCFCSPVYEDAALNELLAMSGTRYDGRPVPGVLLLRAEDDYPIEERLAAQPPVFTRQVVIDLTQVKLQGDPEVDAVAVLGISAVEAVGAMGVCDAGGRMDGAAARLRDAVAVRAAGASSGRADPPLAVLIDGDAYVGRALWGAGLRSAPRWLAGRPDLPYMPDLVSRSALKLLEALALFAIPVEGEMAALDLGAAPGGWTQVLAMRGARVTAVDPGALDSRVASLSGVKVRAISAQSYLRGARERFDLIVNDMRLDARDSARIMVAMAPLLGVGGWGLITLKLPHQAPTAAMRQALTILAAAYSWSQARCLFFNRHEVTVCVRR